MLYFFSEHSYRGNHAGTKARNDVETILQQTGAMPINSRIYELRSDEREDQIYSNVENRFDLFKLFWDIKKLKNQTVIIQYPMLAFDFQEKYFKEIAKKNHLVLLVHDLHSLRIPDKRNLELEISLLNTASVLIVHNRFMKQKIKELGVNVSQIYCLELFDYLYTGTLKQMCNKNNSVAFAGNLEKSMFFSELIKYNPDIEFKFYGIGWEDELNARNAKYCGNFSPEIIPEKLNASYGLVWDGDSVIDGAGPLGEYTLINNPHKLSLYLAAGMPVIVWKDAAVAELITKYNVGIVVERIDNLGAIFENITDKMYIDMKHNVLEIREKIVCGYFLKHILKQL